MDVSVIIVNYNTSQLTIQAISSLYACVDEGTYEVIVVDSSSTEDLSALKSFCEEKEIRLVLLDENVGFGMANNKGARYAKGRNLFFMNPDIILLNNAVKILSDYLDTHPGVAACGGNLFTEDQRPSHSYSFFMPSITQEVDFICGRVISKLLYPKDAEFNPTENPMRVAYICGADLMVKREIFEKEEGFSPDFFLYYEETDLQQRMRQDGYEIYSVPQARAIHLDGRSFRFSEEREMHAFNGRNAYFRKHHPAFYHYVSNLINKTALSVGVLLYSLLGKKEKKEKYRFRLQLYKKSYAS